MSNRRKQSSSPDGSPDELLDHLESIRALLDEERAAAEAAEAADGAEAEPDRPVPLLDDMIRGAYELKETADLLSPTPALGGAGGSRRPYLREDIFEALLGDRWKSSAADILTEARGAIEAHRNQWTPEDTDELNEALRVRIDETLSEWLKATVSERLDELHAALLQTAETVLDEKIRALIERRTASLDDPTTD